VTPTRELPDQPDALAQGISSVRGDLALDRMTGTESLVLAHLSEKTAGRPVQIRAPSPPPSAAPDPDRPPPVIQMDFVDVPPIDNTQISAHFNNLYSIAALSQRLRQLI
jgi:hypothetical protein